jgi:hypothetical protein
MDQPAVRIMVSLLPWPCELAVSTCIACATRWQRGVRQRWLERLRQPELLDPRPKWT